MRMGVMRMGVMRMGVMRMVVMHMVVMHMGVMRMVAGVVGDAGPEGAGVGEPGVEYWWS